MKHIDFFEFTIFWNNYIAEQTKGIDIKKVWEDWSAWTELVMDKLPKSLDAEFKLNNKIWPEWKKFDLIVGTDDYFEDIFYYDMSGIMTKEDSFSEYPRHQMILLEHENDYRTCLQEIVKLTYERARTKILITYPEKREHRVSIINNIIRILNQSQTSIEELSEYFIVFGELIDDTLYWMFYEIDFNGVLVNSHLYTNTNSYTHLNDLNQGDFKKYNIWLDFNTVRYNQKEEAISRINIVRPNQYKDDKIIRSSESLGYLEYLENCYVSAVFRSRDKTYNGYIYLDIDNKYWRGIEFEKHMRPTVITQNRSHVLLEIRHPSQLHEVYKTLGSDPKELFPLEFEIHANVKGFPKKGILPGFIYGKEFIK